MTEQGRAAYDDSVDRAKLYISQYGWETYANMLGVSVAQLEYSMLLPWIVIGDEAQMARTVRQVHGFPDY